MTPLKTAIEIAGSTADLANQLGVVPTAVTNWTWRGRVPLKHAIAIQQLTGHKVTVLDFFPELASVVAPIVPRRRRPRVVASLREAG